MVTENTIDAAKEFQSAKSELDTATSTATGEYLGSVNPLMGDISGIRKKEAETKLPTVEIPEAPKLEMGTGRRRLFHSSLSQPSPDLWQ